MKDIKYINCSVCNKPMPELRLTKFGYKFCVNCSETKPKKALNVTFGEGDHTYNETIIIDD